MRNFFGKTFLVSDAMKEVSSADMFVVEGKLSHVAVQCRRMINSYEENPNSLAEIRAKLQVISEDIILLTETLSYLDESLQNTTIPPEPRDQNGRALYERLQIDHAAAELSRRVHDLKKNLRGAEKGEEPLCVNPLCERYGQSWKCCEKCQTLLLRLRCCVLMRQLCAILTQCVTCKKRTSAQ